MAWYSPKIMRRFQRETIGTFIHHLPWQFHSIQPCRCSTRGLYSHRSRVSSSVSCPIRSPSSESTRVAAAAAAAGPASSNRMDHTWGHSDTIGTWGTRSNVKMKNYNNNFRSMRIDSASNNCIICDLSISGSRADACWRFCNEFLIITSYFLCLATAILYPYP